MKKGNKEIGAMNIKDLNTEVAKLRSELIKEKMDFHANAPKNTNLIFQKRKKLARLLTSVRKQE